MTEFELALWLYWLGKFAYYYSPTYLISTSCPHRLVGWLMFNMNPEFISVCIINSVTSTLILVNV